MKTFSGIDTTVKKEGRSRFCSLNRDSYRILHKVSVDNSQLTIGSGAFPAYGDKNFLDLTEAKMPFQRTQKA